MRTCRVPVCVCVSESTTAFKVLLGSAYSSSSSVYKLMCVCVVYVACVNLILPPSTSLSTVWHSLSAPL